MRLEASIVSAYNVPKIIKLGSSWKKLFRLKLVTFIETQCSCSAWRSLNAVRLQGWK